MCTDRIIAHRSQDNDSSIKSDYSDPSVFVSGFPKRQNCLFYHILIIYIHQETILLTSWTRIGNYDKFKQLLNIYLNQINQKHQPEIDIDEWIDLYQWFGFNWNSMKLYLFYKSWKIIS